MLLSKTPLDRGRVELATNLTPEEVERLVADPDTRILQCASPVALDTWDLLNQSLFARRPDIELRVYGFSSSVCDLSFVSKMKNVRRFSADCLMRATGVENVAALGDLEELSIGIYGLDNFDFLAQIPHGITSLSLLATKSRKPRLDLVSRFQSLRHLYIEGQQQGIEVLSELVGLEDLTLRSIGTPNVDYISKLPRLWSLDVKLGGIKNFSAIAGNKNIKYLELWQIRGLEDISVVSSLEGLQFLFLQSLRNVTEIPDLSRLAKLRRIYLENMKGLRDVSAICNAPALEEFIHISARNIAPESYKCLMDMPTLRQVGVGFGARRRNEDFENLAARSGKSKYRPTKFVFQ